VNSIAKKKVGLMGRKVGMTQIFSDRGEQIPVTVIKAGPCLVVEKRVKAKDGYDAVQLGFEEVTRKRGVNKPMAGQFKKAGVAPQRFLREVRDMGGDEYEIGQSLKADLFKVGDTVRVQGVSKGRGFAGVVKRHNFAGGPKTHGSMFHRAPGSIGAAAYPSRVFKGMRLPGQMGNTRVTHRGMQIVAVDTGNDLILIRGAVPGANQGMVIITAERD
jgi:large subunit ribosomal protein L3